MAGFFDRTPQANRLRKWLALILFALALILTVFMLVWWSQFADGDTEEGPIVNEADLIGDAEIAPPTPGLYNPAGPEPGVPETTPSPTDTAVVPADTSTTGE